MCPPPTLSCCPLSIPPHLLPVPEVDLLSDISEEDPFGEADQSTLESLDGLSTGGTPEQAGSEAATVDSVLDPFVAPPQPDCPSICEETLKSADRQDSELGSFSSNLSKCFASGFPSFLDEDGYLVLPSLPRPWVSFLPPDVQHCIPLTSPSFIPSLLLIFGLLLSASQSVSFSLTFSLPLALVLCYLEEKATAFHVFYDCDLNDKPEEEEAVGNVPL